MKKLLFLFTILLFACEETEQLELTKIAIEVEVLGDGYGILFEFNLDGIQIYKKVYQYLYIKYSKLMLKLILLSKY